MAGFDGTVAVKGPLALECPDCDRPTMCEVLGQGVEGAESLDAGEDIIIRLVMVGCSECTRITVLESVELRPDEWSELYRVWPAQFRDLSPEIPSDVRGALEEARSCFLRARAYSATVVMTRRAVELACKAERATGRDLRQKLLALKAAQKIEGRLFDWADDLRMLGNEGAHGDQSSRQDAEDALSFAEALFDYMFVLADKYEQFKERRARK
ncbi:DUF4145 domain-containing protein [Streptomyces sp. NRRL S-495]|uniref:DUF4145 domain-containing protein n=1 Tax=Streptomyces sp. NRRL S-495 TaxID=1609133 RepID=UPI0005F92AFD|nr:DUF4145 domain-containing protein [Streptomyces sp. NRRL S-495]KJY38123.1 hypothetical protein VR45_06735 [Streptomyces sp. NRRL S-495]